jgi:hypothetical protein
MHATPKDLMVREILVDGQQVSRWERSAHSGNTFASATTGAKVIEKAGEVRALGAREGTHKLAALAEYRGGGRKEHLIEVVLAKDAPPAVQPSSSAALGFQGRGFAGPKVKLTADGKRGSRVVQVESTEGLAPGDGILIEAPKTERWDKLVRNACLWGSYRRYCLQIESVDGNTLRVNQPLRLEYTIMMGRTCRRWRPSAAAAWKTCTSSRRKTSGSTASSSRPAGSAGSGESPSA